MALIVSSLGAELGLRTPVSGQAFTFSYQLCNLIIRVLNSHFTAPLAQVAGFYMNRCS